MTVSVITVCYNSEATIRETIESVLMQDYPHLEYVIVDGGSRDQTLSIIEEYRDRISKIISEPDRGIYDAMNKGIASSTGAVIGLLNSDDIYSGKDSISRIVDGFQNSACDTTYADLAFFQAPFRITRFWKSAPLRMRAFYWGWMPPHPTMFVKREIYEKEGGFRLDLGSAADYEFMLRVYLKGGATAKYLRFIPVLMRAGGASDGGLSRRMKVNKLDRRAWAVNGLRPFSFTRYLKPVRKLAQFLPQPRLQVENSILERMPK